MGHVIMDLSCFCIMCSLAYFPIGGYSLSLYLNIIQILVSIALITLTAVQSRGSSASVFGGESSIQHKRRGMEKTLFNLTIILAVVFFLTSIANVLVQS